MDWLTFIEKVAYPVAVSGALAWCIWKFVTEYAWPIVIQRLEEARIDRQKQLEQAQLEKDRERLDRIEERNLFLTTMQEFRETSKTESQKVVAALDALTKAVNNKKKD